MATWSFDTSHSSIGFSVRHLMISKVRGHFNQWGGTFDYDEEDATRSKLSVRIDATSIDTRDEKRDAHLRSPDFFDVEKFPALTFESTQVERDGDDFVVTGDLDDPRGHARRTIEGRERGPDQGPVGRRARRLQRLDDDQPQGLRARLERGARDRRRSRR